jgi:hypothetical protein
MRWLVLLILAVHLVAVLSSFDYEDSEHGSDYGSDHGGDYEDVSLLFSLTCYGTLCSIKGTQRIRIFLAPILNSFLWLVMPYYYFLEKLFFIGPIFAHTRYRVSGYMWKEVFPASWMTIFTSFRA